MGDRIQVVFSSQEIAGNILPLGAVITRYSLPSVFVIQENKAMLTPIKITGTDMNSVQVE